MIYPILLGLVVGLSFLHSRMSKHEIGMSFDGFPPGSLTERLADVDFTVGLLGFTALSLIMTIQLIRNRGSFQ